VGRPSVCLARSFLSFLFIAFLLGGCSVTAGVCSVIVATILFLFSTRNSANLSWVLIVEELVKKSHMYSPVLSQLMSVRRSVTKRPTVFTRTGGSVYQLIFVTDQDAPKGMSFQQFVIRLSV
jgi:hypothetical protein